MTIHRSELASFLDKVSGSYPCGIPETVLISPTRESSYSCLFVLVADNSSIADTYSELIDAICVKGLKFERSQCDVRVVAEIPEALKVADAALTIVLGSGRTPGTIHSVSDKTVLFSHSIEKIASEPGLKREFWAHLQGLQRA